MASNVTLTVLQNTVRTRGEYRDPRITDAELLVYINDSIATLYDELVRIDPSRYRTVSSSIAVVSGTSEYSITSAAGTFYKLLGVEVEDSRAPTGWVTLQRYMFDERNDYDLSTEGVDARYELRGQTLFLHPPPTWSANVRLIFIPITVALASGGDTWDSVNKWTEWVVLDVLVKCAMKEGDDWQGWASERERKMRAIRGIADVDQGQPRQRVDVYRTRGRRRRRWWRGSIS